MSPTRREIGRNVVRFRHTQFNNIVLLFSCVIFLVVIGGRAASEEKAPRVKFSVRVVPDHADGIYTCGEQAVFTVTVKRNGEPVREGNISLMITDYIAWTRKPLAEEKMSLGDEPVRMTYTQDTPGFVQCTAQFTNPTGSKKARGGVGVGFDPTRIKAAAVMPDDFDEFWEAGRKELAAIPLDLRQTKCLKWSNEKVDAFKLDFANINNTRTRAYLSVPKGRTPPFPAHVKIPGAGPGPIRPKTKPAAKHGVITLTLSVHDFDIPPYDNPEFNYKDVYRADYSSRGTPDRENLYFYRAILGMDRAIEYLASRPDVDLEHFVVSGSSQGGGFSLILGGLSRRFTAVVSCIPGMCDHAAYLAGHASGWPGLVPSRLRGKRTEEAMKYVNCSAYFDAVNFARKITVPTIMSVALMDDCCKPGTVFAAYNEIRAPKRIFTGPWGGHGSVRGLEEFHAIWIPGMWGQAEKIPPMLETKKKDDTTPR